MLTIGRVESSDVRMASQDPLARSDGFRFVLENIDVKAIEEAAIQVSKMVTVSNLSHFEDCVSFWLAASAGNKIKDLHYILSANGPDELFCGYDRFRRIVDEQGYPAAEKEILKALDSADRLRKQVAIVVSKFGYETCEPFLDNVIQRVFSDYPCGVQDSEGKRCSEKKDLALSWKIFGRAKFNCCSTEESHAIRDGGSRRSTLNGKEGQDKHQI